MGYLLVRENQIVTIVTIFDPRLTISHLGNIHRIHDFHMWKGLCGMDVDLLKAIWNGWG